MNAFLLEDANFGTRLVILHTLVPEARQIDGLKGAFHHKLRDCAAGGGRMHNAMTREARNSVQVAASTAPSSDDRIPIQLADFVEPRPRAMALSAFERRKPMRYHGPNDPFEVVMVDFKVHASVRGSIDHSAGEALAF